jgi:thioredoxin 1
MSEKTNSNVVHATEATFNAVVLQSQLPVLVKFGADWCPPCRAMEPFLEQFARRYANTAVIVEVNRDNDPNLAKTYGVGGIPHLIVFNKGAVVPPPEGEDKFDGVGLPDYPTLRDWVSEMLTGTVAELTPAETAFAQAAQAADQTNDETIAQSQESKDFSAAWGPHAKAFSEAFQAAKAALEAKTIDQAEHDRLVKEAKEANKNAFQSEGIQAVYAKFSAVTTAAEAAFKTAIFAAIDEHFPTPPCTKTTSRETGVPAGEGFCAIGDKSCSS